MKKNKLIQTIILFSAFFGIACSVNQTEKKIKKTKWKFIKEISLDEIAPIGIAKQDTFLWLSDADNNRVVKIDLNGNIIKSYDGFNRPMHIAIQDDKIYIPEYLTDSIKILEHGKISNFALTEQPDAIGGVAVEKNTIAIADFYNNRILLQQENRSSIIGTGGHNDGELYYPTDLDIQDNLIYVADAYNNRVQVFDFDGNYIKMIGWNENINVATGIKVTEKEIIIADFEGNRILIYDLDGKLLQIISDRFSKPTDIEVFEDIMYIANYKSKSISVFQKEQ